MDWTAMFVWVLANKRFNPWQTGLFAGHPVSNVTVRQRRRGRSYRSVVVADRGRRFDLLNVLLGCFAIHCRTRMRLVATQRRTRVLHVLIQAATSLASAL
jgi:hypothetical protein